MKSSVEILMDHAVETLPDSLAKRKTILRAVSHVMNEGHPQFKTVVGMLASLQRHEDQQAKLGLRPSKPQHDGNGHDGHDGHHKKGDGK